MPDDVKLICDMQNEFYGYPLGERYYLAHETNPEKTFSVLWTDLKWLSKFYGVTKFDENCDITMESLNYSRDINFVEWQDMIDRNISHHDYHNIKENCMVEHTDDNGNKRSIKYKSYIDKDGKIIPPRTVSEREPYGLSEQMKEHFRLDMNRGRYVICRYVR